jgi:hypothetical protein
LIAYQNKTLMKAQPLSSEHTNATLRVRPMSGNF